MWNTGLIVLLGIWMLVAPLALHGPDAHAWNNRVVGLAVIALVMAVPRIHRWDVFGAAAVGVWLAASSLVPALLFGGQLLWNDFAVGVLFILLGAHAISRTRGRAAPPAAS
jgi:hypothetical protein